MALLSELHGNGLLGAVVTLTCMGFLLIGYDQGVMGGLINGNPFNDTFNTPDPTVVGIIVAIYEIGCFFGSLITALVGDTLGRKRSIAIGSSIMILGDLLQATAYSRPHIIVARIVSGIGMGFINSTVPVMQAEYSPKASRGLYVCMQLTTLNFGIAVSYWIDYAFSLKEGQYAWRVPIALQAVFPVVILVLLLLVPETPRWLILRKREGEALEVMRLLHRGKKTEQEVEGLHAYYVLKTNAEAKVASRGWRDVFQDDAISSHRRLILACAIQAFGQLSGVNAMIYYSTTLFQKSVGLSPNTSSLLAGGLQTWFFLASFIPWFLIDRVGRKPLFLSMFTLMSVVMAVMAALIAQVQAAQEAGNQDSAKPFAAGAAAMLFIFQGAFTVGAQGTVWVYPTEILPLRLRQSGSSLSTAMNWIWNFAIVQFTPPSLANIGYKTYIVFCVLNAAWVPLIWAFFPETKGLELEEVDRLFDKAGKMEEVERKESVNGDLGEMNEVEEAEATVKQVDDAKPRS